MSEWSGEDRRSYASKTDLLETEIKFNQALKGISEVLVKLSTIQDNQTKLLEEMQSDNKEKHAEHRMSALQHQRQTNATIEKLETRVSELERWKWKTAGIVVGISAILGIIFNNMF